MSATTPTLLERTQAYINTLDLDRRNKLAEFLGVQGQTIRSWLRGKTVPVGKRALQLHYLLDYIGMTDHQWRNTNDGVETVGRAITFGLLSDEELSEAFRDECDEFARIIQMLSGHKHISPVAQKIIDDLAAVHSWHIKEAQAKFNHLRITSEKDKLVAELANKLQQLLPLVQDMTSDKWTEADRYELRDRAGRTTVFELYNALGELCGERARQKSVAERAKEAAAALMVQRTK
ncbi:MAG: hypothetical protein AB7L09_00460 [Nitrospira sp.]